MKIELKSVAYFGVYLLCYSMLGMLFSVFWGWSEMQYFLANKGPNYAGDFVGLYVVVALYFYGPVSCMIASPLHLLVYLKKAGRSRHLYSIALSLVVSLLVAGFFHVVTKN